MRYVTLLWHGSRAVGICVFTSAPRCLAQRNRYFGLREAGRRLPLRAIDRQLFALARVVLHPSYRGAGVAAAFVRRSCELAPRPWIEAQAQMGWINPFFEKAGFVRVGHARASDRDRRAYSALLAGGSHRDGRSRLISRETHRKSRDAEPVYYLFDNRDSFSAG